jgi:histidyl-tRNA synthetase
MIATAGATPQQAERLLQLAELTGTNEEILTQLEPLVGGSETGGEGVARLRDTLAGIAAGGVASDRIRLDVSIARGLDYYTGVIFETFLDQLPSIGSVCSGGRYDNLAGLFTKQELPGIGASLGLDRLLAAMEELEMIEAVRTPAPVLITYFDKQRLHDYVKLAAIVRFAGIGVEVYPDPKKLGQQLKYANGRGFTLALIAGENEFAANTCQVKDLRNGDSTELSLAEDAVELIAHLRQCLTDTSPNTQ